MMAEDTTPGSPAHHQSHQSRAPRSSGGGFLNFFKHLDLYTKIEEDYKVQTSTGAILSMIGWVVIAILVLGEVNNYRRPQLKEHMIVDTSLGQHLRININITFHALTCADVHLDAMDVAGDNQINIENSIFKQRVAPSGKLVGTAKESEVRQLSLVPMPDDYCGSCYGAETALLKCCNTCQELRSAYEAKGWAFNEAVRNSTQCQRDKTNPFENVRAGEGCRIHGTMRVNKVAGNFHIAHGESIVRDGRHIHTFVPSEAPGFNVSHTIHSITFGEPYPDMPKNPLDSTVRYVDAETGTGLFQYFIRVLPTIYTDEWGRQHFTNQYTTAERFRPFALPGLPGEPPQPQGTVLPGIFFVYEVSPFLIDVQRQQMPFLHLFAKICAIVGGIVTISGVLDGLLYRLQKTISRN